MSQQLIFTGQRQGRNLAAMIAAADHIKGGGTVTIPGCVHPRQKARRLGYLISAEVEHRPVEANGKVTGYEFKLRKTITDGHGNEWVANCPECGGEMQVMRPGDARCRNECWARE